MVRTILKIFGYLLLFILLIYLALVGTGNGHLITGIRATYLRGHTSATIDDQSFFDTREIPARDPLPIPESSSYNSFDLPSNLRSTLEKTRSVAFLILKDDSIHYEEYWKGYSDTSHSNSFSMAKSITTILTQMAIQGNYIHGWDDHVIDYLPDFKGPYADSVKLKHLAGMAAGLNWIESYTSPFSITTKAYFGDDIRGLMINEVEAVDPPGREFKYQSGSTEILGLVLRKAIGRDITSWASSGLWKDLHAEHDAFWYLDRENGVELTYCCFNSNARDFSRLGTLMLHHGTFMGERILDSAFVARATQPLYSPNYGMSFWIVPSIPEKNYYFRGLLGQYIIVLPERNMVVVRLGETWEKPVDTHPKDVRTIMESVIAMDNSK